MTRFKTAREASAALRAASFSTRYTEVIRLAVMQFHNRMARRRKSQQDSGIGRCRL
jgi:hypothetical protein